MARSVVAADPSDLTLRVYPGSDSVLLAFDVPDALQPALAGFAVQYTVVGGQPQWLTNRLTFTDPVTSATTPEQRQQIASTTDVAPLQKFHWVHFPPDGTTGEVTYRVIAMLFKDGSETDIESGPEATVTVDVGSAPHPGFSFGFTRGYVSSQAYASKFHNAPLQPSKPTIDFDTTDYAERYVWLGAKARELLFAFIAEAVGDPSTTLDVFAYDFNEPDVIRELEKLGPRLRLFQDNSDSHVGAKALEPKVCAAIAQSAGAGHVKLGDFSRFQHNKVMILRRGGTAVKVLAGSANFSVRGLYVQSNNVFVFDDPEIAGHYADAFDQAWTSPHTGDFTKNPVSQQWFDASSPALAKLSVALSPHKDPLVSLGPVAEAIQKAETSVLFAIMEIGAGSGPVLEAVKALPGRSELYAFGTTQRDDGSLKVTKPGQESHFIEFSYLHDKVPPPFQAEYSGGAGQVIHHKFVVVDFNGPNPIVFTGSSNLAAGGEQQNGDNLIAIHDPDVAFAYAIEAIGLIDHYQFRAAQEKADDATPLRLKHRSEQWAAAYYDQTSPKYKERRLFAYPPKAAS
jgi:hypothetical protein